MTLRQEYRDFISDNFKDFKLIKPVFYNWIYGLRFNLQVGKTDTDEYFENVISRAYSIFDYSFNDNDRILLLFRDYKYKRRKIRFYNYIFKQISGLKRNEIEYIKIKKLYEHYDNVDISNMSLIKLTKDRLNIKNIFKVISYKDFSRKPSLDKLGCFSDKEIYFININKKLIFHMYDDRGLDIIASNTGSLKDIYIRFNDWILECDRLSIDKQFE